MFGTSAPTETADSHEAQRGNAASGGRSQLSLRSAEFGYFRRQCAYVIIDAPCSEGVDRVLTFFNMAALHCACLVGRGGGRDVTWHGCSAGQLTSSRARGSVDAENPPPSARVHVCACVA